jgi:hypothetical protein
MNALEQAQGKVRNLRIRSGKTSVSLNYIAPDKAACFVDYGTDPSWTFHTRMSDSGGPLARNTVVSGLTPGKLYYYRLQCASEQPYGSFVTTR